MADGDAALGQGCQDGTQVLNCANTQNAYLPDLSSALVRVEVGITAADDHQAVIDEISKVGEKNHFGLFFAILEEDEILFVELINDSGQEVECVGLVLLVGIKAAHGLHDVLHDFWLGQHLEESFVLAKLGEDVS